MHDHGAWLAKRGNDPENSAGRNAAKDVGDFNGNFQRSGKWGIDEFEPQNVVGFRRENKASGTEQAELISE